jgi:hypothetical protein
VAATYDGATVRLYVNGAQVASTANTGAMVTSNSPLRIGGDSVWGEYFKGLIDEVRIYNRALTAAQIQADMNTAVAGPLVKVASAVVDDGFAQRSLVRKLTVTFSGVVNLGANAFAVTRTSDGLIVGVTATTAMVNGQTVATLTFGGTGTEFGSLADGRYTLSVVGAQITDTAGRSLDGDGDGAAGGNYQMSFFRFFGDINGDAFVNGADFALFRTAFGTGSGDPNYSVAFDFNGDGFVNGADFAAFRIRFGTSI